MKKPSEVLRRAWEWALDSIRHALWHIYCPHCKSWFQRHHLIGQEELDRAIAFAKEEEQV